MHDRMQGNAPVRTNQTQSAPKSLADALRAVYGPAYRPGRSGNSRIRVETIPIETRNALRAESVDSVTPQDVEFEKDPFEDEFDNDNLDNELAQLLNDESIQHERPSASSSFSFIQKPLETGSEIELQNQRSRNTPHLEEENQDDEEENWEGFDDSISSSNFDIPPPPISSFDSRELALQAVQKWTREHGYALRIRDQRKRHRDDALPYVTYFECDRAGKNKPHPKADGKQLRKSSTRRRECPFRCIIRQSKRDTNALWSVHHCEPPHNEHNHGPSYLSTAHPIHRRNARKSRPEMLRQIENNKISRISAKDTLSSLQNQFPDAPLTLRDVENVYDEVKKAMNRGLPAIQAMIAKVDNSFQYHYVLDEHDRLERVLFFHDASLQLLQLFPKSYILDATYRTNRFNLPLLDIVGFTATNSSFIIGQAFLTHEAEEDYIWILTWIREIYEKYKLPTPESITTDKAGGLHNACGVVWPEVPHLLCRWHIDKDVRGYCQKHWLVHTENRISNDDRKTEIDENVKEFAEFWTKMLYAETELDYTRNWLAMQEKYRDSQPQILSYLVRIWLPYKETFVRAWTDRIRHYGNVDSSRAEGVHQAIKRRMGSKQIHLNDVVDYLSRYLILHNNKLREELEYGQQKERTDLQNPLYRNLHGHISYYAIDQVEAHRRFHNLSYKRAHLPLLPCKQRFTTTKGLPCAHLLQRRILEHLPLDITDFDIQWRIDRLGELAKLPPLRKITDPQTVRARYSKSQKRQLSLFEVVQAQVDSLTPTQSKKGKEKIKRRPQAVSQVQIKRGESSRAGTASQPLYVDEDEEFDSENDPLGAELRREQQQQRQSSLYQQSAPGIQIRGWVEYERPKPTTPPPPPPPPLSPLFSPLPELRTPSPFADLDLSPLPSPSPVPSIETLFRRSPAVPSSSSPPNLSTAISVSPMTSPAKKRPRRDITRPQRYRVE